jgi:hypothetical protein
MSIEEVFVKNEQCRWKICVKLEAKATSISKVMVTLKIQVTGPKYLSGLSLHPSLRLLHLRLSYG